MERSDFLQNIKALGNVKGHLTNAEKEERAAREELFERDSINLVMPEYLNEDDVAKRFWEQICSDAEEFKIFDNLDCDVLGTYCSIMSRIVMLRRKYWSAVKGHRKNSEIIGISKELRFQETLQLTYAGKLGLTPEARMRLAQKIVIPEDDPDDDLYG